MMILKWKCYLILKKEENLKTNNLKITIPNTIELI